MPTAAMPHFRPAKDEEWYYQLSIPAAHTGSALYTTFVQPHLKVEDPTYGRGAMPIAPVENAIRNNPAYDFREEKAYFNSEQTEWVYYQVRKIAVPLPVALNEYNRSMSPRRANRKSTQTL